MAKENELILEYTVSRVITETSFRFENLNIFGSITESISN